MPARHAFITGANGISGTALLEHLVKNTTADEWGSITITSRSPFATPIHDPRVKFIALDYTENVETLLVKVGDTCQHVTHAYFYSYVHKDDFAKLNAANEALFENFVDSLERVAPNLENITLQTGGKYYQAHLKPVPYPVSEHDPRLDAPLDNFYFPQEDKLAASQKGKKWSWNVVRPVAIIGATTRPNGMNEAITLAMYFLICRELGVTADMPTNQRYWRCVEDLSYGPLIADLTVFVSTHQHCANEAFNVTNGDFICWRYLWPRLASYFGATASSDQVFSKPEPQEGELQQDFTMADWASADKRDTWAKLCERQAVPSATDTFAYGTWSLVDWAYRRTWSGPMSINKAREYGWSGHIDSYRCFVETFERFKDLGLLPP